MANVDGRDRAAPGRSSAAETSSSFTPSPGKQTLSEALPSGVVQRKVGQAAASPGDVHAAAARGTAGSGGQLPYFDQIQASFGSHDISHVKAHVGGAATEASQSMGAEAYASGDHVAFASAPSLHTAAHEAAHVVQQRGGVQLQGGVGAAGDRYEQNADAVADRVVQGKSSEDLLTSIFGRPDTRASSGGSGAAVQHIVMSTASKKGRGGKFYSSMDDTRMFETFDEADAYDQQLLAARRAAASGGAKAAPAPAKVEPAKPAPAKIEPAPAKVEPAKPAPAKVEPAPAKAEPAPAKAEPVKAEPAVDVPAKKAGKVGPRTLEDVEDADWLEQWSAKRAEVIVAMQAFVSDFTALDGEAVLQIRGSLASGIKGAQKLADDGQRLLFNPDDFDIDAYVVSNELFRQADAAAPDSARNGQIPGSKLKSVNDIIKKMRVALAEVAGNRDAPEASRFQFNVLIRSGRNAAFTKNKDRNAMAKIDLPADWGDPVTVRAAD